MRKLRKPPVLDVEATLLEEIATLRTTVATKDAALATLRDTETMLHRQLAEARQRNTEGAIPCRLTFVRNPPRYDMYAQRPNIVVSLEFNLGTHTAPLRADATIAIDDIRRGMYGRGLPFAVAQIAEQVSLQVSRELEHSGWDIATLSYRGAGSFTRDHGQQYRVDEAYRQAVSMGMDLAAGLDHTVIRTVTRGEPNES